MEYCLGIKMNEIFPFAANQMGLEDIMLSAIHHIEKEKLFLWYSVHRETKKSSTLNMTKINLGYKTKLVAFTKKEQRERRKCVERAQLDGAI